MRLYHYTSIGNLALILHNQTIRFKRLDQLDDLNEVGIYQSEISKRYFVSCWTNSEEESISQWNMYGHNKRGVIIGLDTSLIQYPKEPIIDQNIEHVITYDVNLGEPFPIEYLELPELKDRALQIEQINEVGGVSTQGQLGNIKSKHWAFQKEYRLSILIHKLPVPINTEPENSLEVNTPTICHFDLKLDDGFKKDITITLGPLCTDSDRVIVESLVKTYDVFNPLQESVLTDTLRRKF